MGDSIDKELEKTVKELVHGELWKYLRRLADLTQPQISINPLDIDYDLVPSGPFQFNGFVVNAGGTPTITLALFNYPPGGGNASISLTPAISGNSWSAAAILASGIDYGLQATLTCGSGTTTTTTSSQIFFSTVTPVGA